MSDMSHHDSDLVAALLEALTAATKLHCLSRRDGVRFRDEHEDARELDAVLQVRMPDGQVLELAIETRRTAYPRDVRLAVEQLWAYEGSRTEGWYGFSPEGITSALAKGLVDRDGWALTGAAAANLLVPTLTSVDRAVVVVPPGKGKDWAEELKLKPADKGANVVFVEREGAALPGTRGTAGCTGPCGNQ